MNNCKTQSVGQKLVDPSEKLRRESADRTKEQTKSDNAVPKVATSKAASLSEKSRWEAGTEGSDPLNNRHFGSQLIHEHGKNSGSEIPTLTEFEASSDNVGHDPRERKSGSKQRKAK